MNLLIIKLSFDRYHSQTTKYDKQVHAIVASFRKTLCENIFYCKLLVQTALKSSNRKLNYKICLKEVDKRKLLNKLINFVGIIKN